jgi:curved DNA-binding protein
MKANVTIDLYTALLGGEIMLQLSHGAKIKLKVKAGTQPGTKVRVRGQGHRLNDGSMGDLIITYQVKLPTQLSEHQKELVRQMQNA